MTSWQPRSLSLILLLLVASSSLLNLAEEAAALTTSDIASPLVLIELAEEAEADESSDFLLFAPAEGCQAALEINYAAHIAEECEDLRACQRKAHFWRGPPATDAVCSRR